jgi:hypothetical protein
LALRELHASCTGEKAEAIGEIPACRCGEEKWMALPTGAIGASRLSYMEK